MGKQGYITMAIDSEQSTCQIRSAYSLACSLRLADPDREIALVTDKFKNVPLKYEDAFDYIIELPYGVTDITESNRSHNLWQIYYCTPFDENLYVNPASLAVDNITSYWDTFVYDSIIFPTNTMNFQLNESVYFEGRDVFEKNGLIDIHSDIFYFKRDEFSANFFKMADIVFQNWRQLFFEYIKENRPEIFDADIAFALTAYMMGESLKADVNQLTYIDLTPYNVTELNEEYLAAWLDSINIWFFKGNKVKVNNHRQTGFFVYHDFDLLTEEATNELRKHRKTATTKI